MKHYIPLILESSGSKNRSDLARKLGISRSLIAHWEAGRRDITPATAKKIEMLTLGKVDRAQLRPDIFA